MAETAPFTIEQFYRFMSQGKLMAAQCMECGKIMLPPRPVCDKCFSDKLQWKELTPKGRLETYTVIHVAPPKFQPLTPYTVGIVRLEEGIRLPGMIKGVELENLHVGLELEIAFDSSLPSEWPAWPKYYFKPA